MPTPEKKLPARWRPVNTLGHKRVKRKIKISLGHTYLNTRGVEVPSREIGNPCNFKNKCRESLAEMENAIFTLFWDFADYDKQNIYIAFCLKVVPKKRAYPKKTKRRESTRKVSVKYRVRVNNGKEIEICKGEFLSVHGLLKRRVERIVNQIKEGNNTPK